MVVLLMVVAALMVLMKLEMVVVVTEMVAMVAIVVTMVLVVDDVKHQCVRSFKSSPTVRIGTILMIGCVTRLDSCLEPKATKGEGSNKISGLSSGKVGHET